MTKEPPLIEIAKASVAIDGQPILHDMDLVIRPGESTAILGRNGAGKTTLLRLLTRDLYPVRRDGTRVRLLGRERWNVFELRREMGIVSQELQERHQRRLRLFEVVASGYFSSIGLYRHQRLPADHRQRIASLLRQLRIAELSERTFETLSTGEQRRALLARALVHQPRALLLDEPTASLDLEGAFGFLELLRRWLADGDRTLVMVTHRLREIVPEIERVVLMNAGRIVFDGVKEEALRSARISETLATPVRVVSEQGYYQAVPDRAAYD